MAEVHNEVFRGASVTEASETASWVVPTMAWAGWPRQVALEVADTELSARVSQGQAAIHGRPVGPELNLLLVTSSPNRGEGR